MSPRSGPHSLAGFASGASRMAGGVSRIWSSRFHDAVPRWTWIGASGLLLLGLGATYERRVREVRLLHERAVFGAVQRAIRRTLAGLSGPRPPSLLGLDELGPAPAAGQGEWMTGLRILGQAGGTYIIAEGSTR